MTDACYSSWVSSNVVLGSELNAVRGGYIYAIPLSYSKRARRVGRGTRPGETRERDTVTF
jgi:hypothetical protein